MLRNLIRDGMKAILTCVMDLNIFSLVHFSDNWPQPVRDLRTSGGSLNDHSWK